MKPVQWPDSFDAADYAGVVRRRWPIVLALTIIGLVAAFAYVQVAPKSYTGTAALNILPTGLDQANGAQNSRVSSASVNLDTEAQLITSTTIAAAAAHLIPRRGSDRRVCLRHIYGVRRVQIILSTVVFWRSWQVCKPNRTCYN